MTAFWTAACATGQISHEPSSSNVESDQSDENGSSNSPQPAAQTRGVLGGPQRQAVLVGRFDLSDPNAPRFNLPNSKIGVRFTGTSVGVLLADTGYDVFNVTIDGTSQPPLSTVPSNDPTLNMISTSLSAGSHTLWLTKRTEGLERDQVDNTRLTGTVTFGGLVLSDGETFLAPPSTQPRLIETIGDSGFNGYGVGGGNASCKYTIEQQDADSSVPALLASELGAEVVNVSVSGKGVYNSVNDPNDFNTMIPYAYRQTLPPRLSPTWSGGEVTVDAVIIDIGSNDLFGDYASGYFPDPNAVLSAYVGLLADIRSQHAQAPIFCATSAGTTGSDRELLSSTIEKAIAIRAQAGDAQIFAVDYFANDPNAWQTYSDAASALNLGFGCEGHASAAGAQFLAGRLAPLVRNHLQWSK